jgi:hypothetical protein
LLTSVSDLEAALAVLGSCGWHILMFFTLNTQHQRNICDLLTRAFSDRNGCLTFRRHQRSSRGCFLTSPPADSLL